MTTLEIEKILGDGNVKQSEYLPDIEVGHYMGGVTVEYTENSAGFIGVLLSFSPTHLDFTFADRSYDEVMNYFKQYPGNIYIEGEDTSIISEHLGISTYFEDGIKQVGIFSENYRADLVKDLELVNR